MHSIKTVLNQPIDPLDAEVLLSFVLKKPKEYLFVHMHKCVPPKKQQKFLSLVSKRQKGWPVAYLTGQKEFFGLKFFVNNHVLIPRPETEGLVELVLSKAKSQKHAPYRSGASGAGSKVKILDIGTGSGNIIISLAKTLFAYSRELGHQYFASDISKKALAVAKKNTRQHATKITFKQGSLLKPWKNYRFDIIIANLPYLAQRTDPSTKFEPKRALITQNKGLYLIEKLFEQIQITGSPIKACPGLDPGSGMTKGPKFIFLEFDPRQTTQIKKLARKILPEYSCEIIKDLAGKNRFACLSLQNFL